MCACVCVCPCACVLVCVHVCPSACVCPCVFMTLHVHMCASPKCLHGWGGAGLEPECDIPCACKVGMLGLGAMTYPGLSAPVPPGLSTLSWGAPALTPHGL